MKTVIVVLALTNCLLVAAVAYLWVSVSNTATTVRALQAEIKAEIKELPSVIRLSGEWVRQSEAKGVDPQRFGFKIVEAGVVTRICFQEDRRGWVEYRTKDGKQSRVDFSWRADARHQKLSIRFEWGSADITFRADRDRLVFNNDLVVERERQEGSWPTVVLTGSFARATN
jgi:hypothetical protein